LLDLPEGQERAGLQIVVGGLLRDGEGGLRTRGRIGGPPDGQMQARPVGERLAEVPAGHGMLLVGEAVDRVGQIRRGGRVPVLHLRWRLGEHGREGPEVDQHRRQVDLGANRRELFSVLTSDCDRALKVRYRIQLARHPSGAGPQHEREAVTHRGLQPGIGEGQGPGKEVLERDGDRGRGRHVSVHHRVGDRAAMRGVQAVPGEPVACRDHDEMAVDRLDEVQPLAVERLLHERPQEHRDAAADRAGPAEHRRLEMRLRGAEQVQRRPTEALQIHEDLRSAVRLALLRCHDGVGRQGPGSGEVPPHV
jgi:hypothetical protein